MATPDLTVEFLTPGILPKLLLGFFLAELFLSFEL